MASYLDKFKVKTAVKDHTKLDLSCQHVTTADFFQLNPIYIKEMVPGERISVNAETFTRLAPLAVPTFGRMQMKNRAFFIPFRTIFRGWNDFITDTTHVLSNNTNTFNIGSQVPRFSLESIATIFKDNTGPTGYCMSIDPRDETADLVITDVDVTPVVSVSYRLTPKGRQVVKILQSLGYQIPTEFGQSSQMANCIVSALPLLAFAKVYCDWYFPSQYYDDPIRMKVEKYFNSDLNASGLYLTTDQLKDILDLIYSVNYDSDYFVSAFSNPAGPVNGSYSSVEIEDPTNGGSGSNVNYIDNAAWSNGTPAISRSTTAVGPLTQFAIDTLKAMTDYMKRHQLVGARALDRYLARFGKSLSSEKLNRSNYIGSQSVDIQIGDVTANAETGNSFSTLLGGYAGKGVGYDSKSFDYETDEYGLFVILSSIVPSTGYYQGMDRMVTHLTRTDFWTPEYDQLGNQAIMKTELFMPDMNDGTWINNNPNYLSGVFGWAPRYAEYKIGRDKLTGDFRIASLNVAGDSSDSWHLFREIKPSTADDVVVGLNFVKGDVGSGYINEDNQYVDVPTQYDRIFSYVDNKCDHFYCIHNFNVVSWSPMLSLYDTYDFDGGKEIVADVNGVKVN